MVAVGLGDCQWVVKNTFLELGYEREIAGTKGLRRSASECRIASSDMADVPSRCDLDDEKLETASITTMDFESENLDDLSTVYELSSAATEDTASSQDVAAAAPTFGMPHAVPMPNPWMPMVQVVVVDSSKMSSGLRQVQSNKAQTRTRKGAGFDSSSSEENAEKDLTTVMLRNLPTELTRDMLLQLLNDQGFAGEYNFIYSGFFI